MFCMKCGAKLPDEAAFCMNCGTSLGNEVPKGESNLNQHEMQNNKSPLNQPERVIMQGLCNRVKSKLYVQNGKAMLTNHRFVYLKHSFAKVLAIGVFVNLTSGDFDFDIPLSEIQSIEDGRQGISKTIIINTKSGERYEFYFTKREEWKIAIENAMQEIK